METLLLALCIGSSIASVCLLWLPIFAINVIIYPVFDHLKALILLATLFVLFGYYLNIRYWRILFGGSVSKTFWTVAVCYNLISALVPLGLIAVSIYDTRDTSWYVFPGYIAKAMLLPFVWCMFAVATSFYFRRHYQTSKIP